MNYFSAVVWDFWLFNIFVFEVVGVGCFFSILYILRNLVFDVLFGFNLFDKRDYVMKYFRKVSLLVMGVIKWEELVGKGF